MRWPKQTAHAPRRTQVQQDLLPDISIPAVIVITPQPGASPQIVDSQVTVPMANAMQGVTGVDTVQSTSSQGLSLVVVVFKDGVDLKTAQQDVNTAVSRARPLLPAQTPASTVQTFSTNSLPSSSTRSPPMTHWAISPACFGDRRCRS